MSKSHRTVNIRSDSTVYIEKIMQLFFQILKQKVFGDFINFKKKFAIPIKVCSSILRFSWY